MAHVGSDRAFAGSGKGRFVADDDSDSDERTDGGRAETSAASVEATRASSAETAEVASFVSSARVIIATEARLESEAASEVEVDGAAAAADDDDREEITSASSVVVVAASRALVASGSACGAITFVRWLEYETRLLLLLFRGENELVRCLRDGNNEDDDGDGDAKDDCDDDASADRATIDAAGLEDAAVAATVVVAALILDFYL